MGCPTMVLVSAISRILSIVERIKSLRGLFLSIVSSMDAILSRHAAGCSAALLSAALDAGGIRRRFMNRRSQPMAGTASCVPTAISVPSRMEMPSFSFRPGLLRVKINSEMNAGIPDHHQLLQSRHPGPDQRRGVHRTTLRLPPGPPPRPGWRTGAAGLRGYPAGCGAEPFWQAGHSVLAAS